MKKSILSAAVIVASSLFFAACEDDAIPVPLPPPPQPVAEAPAEPEADSAAITEKAADTAIAKPAAPTAIAPAPAPAVTQSQSEVGQQNSGRYVIQVAVYPSEKAANALVKKLAEYKISAYSVRVNNPAKLLGPYYRVRVGYFKGKSVAEKFKEERLTPLGYNEAWIDNTFNDANGNPVETKPAVSVQTTTAPAKAQPATQSATSAPAQKTEPAPAAKPQAAAPSSAPAPSATVAPKTEVAPAPVAKPQAVAPAASQPSVSAPVPPTAPAVSTPAPATVEHKPLYIVDPKTEVKPAPQSTPSKEIKIDSRGKVEVLNR